MSCNGCRVLRKGCSENCMLRHCLQLIENPQAQAHATLFVAKFFGRAALMSFLSAVPANQRSALFQSLLYEAVGRTINPVNGAVGLLWSGNWQLCQMGVEKVLRGGAAFLSSVDVHHQHHVTERVMIAGGTLCHQAKKQRVGTTSQESETFYMGRKPQDSAPQSQRNLLTLFF
ncbi:LOB domain-containing protein 38 isoform X1 [Vigna radiata var. radiata]|uniref:LOB domain-containing protein 38 isoform X1 n=1 Tax=Vigna radiata var. radiata TaxID=3916 RepID=A0A1S3V7I9_VIGRR|nr:LOB domain-containing protein 38 isoform X1 [Vigna radiata var. radiata]